MRVTEQQRITIKLANDILKDLRNFKYATEAQMKAHVKLRVENFNKMQVGLPEIQKNDVYKILGESLTCFWGHRE